MRLSMPLLVPTCASLCIHYLLYLRTPLRTTTHPLVPYYIDAAREEMSGSITGKDGFLTKLIKVKTHFLLPISYHVLDEPLRVMDGRVERCGRPVPHSVQVHAR